MSKDPTLDELKDAVDALGDDAEPIEPNVRKRLLSKLAARLQNPRQLSGDAMELAAAVLETSDRAKTEAVRMVAREVRNYLEELKLTEDLHELITNHSLEVHLSLSLKPLARADKGSTEEAG